MREFCAEDQTIAVEVGLSGETFDHGAFERAAPIGHFLAGIAGGEAEAGIVRESSSSVQRLVCSPSTSPAKAPIRLSIAARVGGGSMAAEKQELKNRKTCWGR